MYLQGKERNKYTIGKWLRKKKRLRERDPQAQATPMPPRLQSYVQELKKEGVQMKGLTYATFRTKNGLPYPGLMATNRILSNTIMMRVPAKLLLNTRDGFLSDVRAIFEQNPLFFSKQHSTDWQDRILLTYILHEYQKGKASRWYSLINNLPRQIDYVIFWRPDQLQQLQDKFFMQGIIKEKEKYDRDQEELKRILSRYPHLFHLSTITPQNIRWIHIHLVSRCFGKYFEYTTMVPFAQLFNHQCTDVYYTMDYDEHNPHNKHQTLYEQKQLTQQQIEENQTSDGSYKEDDFHLENETFNIPFDKNSPWEQINLPQEVKKELKNILTFITSFICFNDNISLGYLSTIYNTIFQSIVLKNKYNILDQVNNSLSQYLRLIKQYHKYRNLPTYNYSINQKKQPPSPPPPQPRIEQSKVYFDSQWKPQPFDDFLMLCSTKDQFDTGSQVYFCYGRLPNNLLLMRYGFALEYNKYNHLFLRLDTTPTILQCLPLWFTACSQVDTNIYERFKLKATEMNIDVLTSLRAKKWLLNQPLQHIFHVVDLSQELKVLSEARSLYMDALKGYKMTLQQNEAKLHDKALNYHEYFAVVYKLEQQRILAVQIDLLRYAMGVIEQIITQKESLEDVLSKEEVPWNRTMQIMMKKYFLLFRHK